MNRKFLEELLNVIEDEAKKKEIEILNNLGDDDCEL